VYRGCDGPTLLADRVGNPFGDRRARPAVGPSVTAIRCGFPYQTRDLMHQHGKQGGVRVVIALRNFYANAGMSVMARPMISVWISSVPS
jgi:hypothetical protein